MESKNCIIIDGVQHNFVEDKVEGREFCITKCSLKEYCYNKLKSNSLLCNIHIDKTKGIVNGYYELDKKG